MRPVRVLFGPLPATFQTALAEAIRSQAGIEVVGTADRSTGLLVAAGTLRADVVVVTMTDSGTDSGMPGIASHLLDQYPQIRVIGVAADGRHALISAMAPCTEQVAFASPADLASAIRSLDRPPD